ncbi:MAG: beta-lactamase family protein [Desulfobulbaceae bacterium]|nr:beta-lactamase family protein [Desulfobulbaceae bacterium]
MNDKKIDLTNLLEQAIAEHVFPSYAAGIYLNRKDVIKETVIISGSNIIKKGNVEEIAKQYYDLASLTKPLSTVLIMVSLVGAGKISLTDPIDKYLPTLPKDKKQITIFQLLNHSSGFPAHLPFFRELEKLPAAGRKKELLRLLLSAELAAQPGTVACYSDLGYLLLGLISEEVSGIALEQYFQEKIVGPLGLAEGIFFNPLGASRKAREYFAPTEYCPWRGRVLRGEVSDENGWVLGGVAGHAGLFGNIESVLALTSAILEIWQGGREHPCIRREELALFLEAPSQVAGSTWALGFDRPTPGSSSSGKYLSPRSVGHLGFTGTSFWIDPDKGLVVVLLTNRVHPSRENLLIREFRPLFHDRVVELSNEILKHPEGGINA